MTLLYQKMYEDLSEIITDVRDKIGSEKTYLNICDITFENEDNEKDEDTKKSLRIVYPEDRCDYSSKDLIRFKRVVEKILYSEKRCYIDVWYNVLLINEYELGRSIHLKIDKDILKLFLKDFDNKENILIAKKKMLNFIQEAFEDIKIDIKMSASFLNNSIKEEIKKCEMIEQKA